MKRNAWIAMALFPLAAVAAERKWQPGPEMAAVLAERPWETKGLTPVEMKPVEGLDPIAFFVDGKPTLPLVIPGEAHPAHGYYRNVASFLADYLKQATGADFATVHETDHEGVGLFIGPCDHASLAPLAKQVEQMEPEHFMVARFADGIAVLGRDFPNEQHPTRNIDLMLDWHSRGSFFAVLDFLERIVGVRFYMPGELGTYVPYARNATLVMPALAYTDGPVFVFRGSSYGYSRTKDNHLLGYDPRPDGHMWMRTMRRGDVSRVRTGHTDVNWHKHYAEDHPEWFALRADGTRMIGGTKSWHAQRCYTNEEAFQEHLRVIQRYYDTGEGGDLFARYPPRLTPNEHSIYWWPNDAFQGCHCEGCMALTDRDARRRERHSRLIWTYTVRLAEEIRKRWPGKRLMASFYGTWHSIPDDITLPDNVTYAIVEHREAYYKEPAILGHVKQSVAEKMSHTLQKVTMWSHYPHRPRIANNVDAPYQAPHILQRYVRWLKDRSYGTYLNGHPSTSFALDGHVLYLYKKMLWNPDIDVDAALAEYCHVTFGPEAGPLVNEYYDTIIHAWENTRWAGWEDRTDHTALRWTHYFRESYPRPMREELQATLNRALALTAEGTAFHARTEWLVKGTEPFFTQGAMLDRGGDRDADTGRMTPKVDGRLEEWADVRPLTLVNNANGEKVAARTEVYTAYDDAHIYFAIRAQEPGELNLAPAGSKRNYPLWNTDSVEIFLCTEQPGVREAGFGIADQYHQIVIDANGNIFDGYRARGSARLDASVNLDFEHASRKTDDGFVIEMAIPFKSLGAVVPESADHWVVNFFRNRSRGNAPGEALHAWVPTIGTTHNTSRFGRLNFTDKILWHSDFLKFDEYWRVSVPNGIEVTQRVEDGILKMHVRRTDDKMGKHDPREIKIIYEPQRKPITTTAAPISADLRWRYSGSGFVRLRFDSGQVGGPRFGGMFSRLGMYRDTGWVMHSVGTKPSVEDPVSVDQVMFALMVSHDAADFQFEVDSLRLRSGPALE